jgi:hypothetical protein
MHEWAVKRGDVQTWPLERQVGIYVPVNCSILHHVCHMRHGQTRKAAEVLARKFIRKYGVGSILKFLEDLKLRQPIDPTVREVLAEHHITTGA